MERQGRWSCNVFNQISRCPESQGNQEKRPEDAACEQKPAVVKRAGVTCCQVPVPHSKHPDDGDRKENGWAQDEEDGKNAPPQGDAVNAAQRN